MAIDPVTLTQYVPTGRNAAGAVARNFTDKLYEAVSVKDFGATGNGSTDDTAAIQAALNFITAAGGGVVHLPAGKYVTSSTLIMNASNLRLIGAGKQVTTIAANFNGDTLAIGTSSSSAMQFVRVSGLQFGPSIAKNSGCEIHIQGNQTDVVLDDFIIQSGYFGILLEANYSISSGSGGGSDYKIRDFLINSCSNIGFQVGTTAGLAQGVYISEGTFGANNVGLYLANVSGLYVDRIDLILSTSHNIVFQPPSNCEVAFCFFDKVTSDSAGGAGWYVVDTGGINAQISCTNCWAAACQQEGVTLNSARLDGFSWTGGIIRDNSMHGIHLLNGNNVIIDANQIMMNGTKTNNTYSGVQVTAGSKCFTITNNILGSGGYDSLKGAACQQAFGIAIETSSTTNYYVVTGNRGAGSIGGVLADNGPSGAAKAVNSNVNG